MDERYELMLNVYRQELRRALTRLTAYNTDRDYDEVLGYTAAPSFEHYLSRYQRQDIAGRIVDLPAIDTWKNPPPVSEDGYTDTEFCKAWELLADRLRVYSMFERSDRLAGIGRYGVLVIGVRGFSMSDPVTKGALDGQKDIIFLRSLSEGSAEIVEWETDPESKRYGMPVYYKVTLGQDGAFSTPQRVHWTHVVHFADNKLDSETYAIPRLQRVLNRLDDMLKLVGGSAEATWLNMRPGILLTNQKDYTLQNLDAATFEREMFEYAHDPLRMLKAEGMDAKQMGSAQVMDPAGPFGVELSLIAAASNIPQRVLIGSAEGQLAAAEQDMKQWASNIASRQKNYADPLLRSFIDRLQLFGALPTARYNIGIQDKDGVWRWPSILEQNPLEQVETMLKKAQAVSTLANPLTGELPIDSNQVLELLGYPAKQRNDYATNSLRTYQDDDVTPPERETFERELYNAVNVILEEQRAQAVTDMQDGIDPNTVELRRALVAVLVPLLVSAAQSRATETQEQLQLFVDDIQLQVELTEWAQDYARRVVNEIAGYTDRLLDLAKNANDPLEFEQLIKRAYGEQRARAISITEITAALSAGFILLNKLYQKTHGIMFDEVWYTQEDERVCPVCGPLHGTTRAVWGLQFPDGPQAHPNCRCFLRPGRVKRNV